MVAATDEEDEVIEVPLMISKLDTNYHLPTIQSEQSFLYYDDDDDGDEDDVVVDEEMLLLSKTEEEKKMEETSMMMNGGGGGGGGAAAANNHTTSSTTTTNNRDNWTSSSSTFERSFDLLSTRWLPIQQVDALTKSPKPGSPSSLFSSRLKRWRKYGGTPDHIYTRKANVDTNVDFLKIQKIKSLDFVPNHTTTFTMNNNNNMHNNKRTKNHHQRYATFGTIDLPSSIDKNKSVDCTGTKTGTRTGISARSSPKKATLAQSIFNMSNTLMGIGVLSLPYAIASVGWVAGMFILFFFTFLTWYTCILIGRLLSYKTNNAKEGGAVVLTSLSQVAMESFGLYGNIVLSAVLYFELFSCLSIFLVTIGDHLYALYPSISHSFHMIMITALLAIPTILLRTPRLLSYMSAVGTLASIAVVFSVMIAAIVEGDLSKNQQLVHDNDNDNSNTTSIDTDNADTYHSMWIPSGIPLCAGLIAFCYSGHAIIPSFYNSIERPEENFDKVLTYSYGIVLLSYSIVGVCGYYTFGNTVQDQITLSLEQITTAAARSSLASASSSLLERIIMEGLTWLMVLTAFSKATLYVFPLSLGVEELLAPHLSSASLSSSSSCLVKIVLLILALLVALLVPSFGILCALVGLICTMIVSFIFPAAAHLKLFADNNNNNNNNDNQQQQKGKGLTWIEFVLDWSIITIGFLVAVVGTIATVT